MSTTRAVPGEHLTILLPAAMPQPVVVSLVDRDGTTTPLRVGTQVGRLLTRVLPVVPGGIYDLTVQLGGERGRWPFTVLNVNDIDPSRALVYVNPSVNQAQFLRDLGALDVPVDPTAVRWVDLPGDAGACAQRLALVAPPAGIRITGAILDALQTVPGVVGADAEGQWRADPISLWDGGKGAFPYPPPPSMDGYYLPPVIGTEDVSSFQGKGSGVTIAILDTGLRREDRAQFGSRLRPRVNSVAADRVTSAGMEDGFRDRRLSVREVGHGSVVARMAAGPQGVARGAEVWPLKVCDDEGLCHTSSVLMGLCTALAEVAPKRLVVNMSLGGNVPNGGVLRTLQAATARGAVVVASVGNEDELASVGRIQSQQHYPASYKGDAALAPSLRGMLVVGAVDRVRSATSWFYSRTGRRTPYLDAVAPGYQEVLFSPKGKPSVNHSSAASFATAIASGVTALWRTYCPQTRELGSADLVRVMLGHTSSNGLDDREATPAFLQTPGGSWWPDSALVLPNGASCP